MQSSERFHEGIEVDCTLRAGANHYATNMFYTMQNGMMLTCRAHCLCCYALRLQPTNGAEYGRICAFGAAASEDNFSGMAAKDIGNIVATLVEHFACVASKTVRTRRVGVLHVVEWLHGRNGFGAHRRGGCMIEIHHIGCHTCNLSLDALY